MLANIPRKRTHGQSRYDLRCLAVSAVSQKNGKYAITLGDSLAIPLDDHHERI